MRVIALTILLMLPPLAASAQNGHGHASHARSAAMPTEAGQSAFAAVQEIIRILESDPHTDWSKVNIAALRDHLVDMNRVMLWTEATAEAVTGGARFVVTGDEALRPAIRSMTSAHAHTMAHTGDWRYEVSAHPDGAAVTVTAADPAAAAKIRALGFYGILARGMHHQPHHLAIARGESPHE